MQSTQYRAHIERYDPHDGLEIATADIGERDLWRLIESLPDDRTFRFRQGRWLRPFEPMCGAPA
jgi:hypothetical protein